MQIADCKEPASEPYAAHDAVFFYFDHGYIISTIKVKRQKAKVKVKNVKVSYFLLCTLTFAFELLTY